METGILGAEQAVMLIHSRDEGATKEYLEEKLREYRETYANPIYEVNANLNVEDVVTPAETRRYLVRAFKVLDRKKVQRPAKKHGNMPL
jgi:acetyl-CoA carboxylase carboxyltransferase component